MVSRFSSPVEHGILILITNIWMIIECVLRPIIKRPVYLKIQMLCIIFLKQRLFLNNPGCLRQAWPTKKQVKYADPVQWL